MLNDLTCNDFEIFETLLETDQEIFFYKNSITNTGVNSIRTNHCYVFSERNVFFFFF